LEAFVSLWFYADAGQQRGPMPLEQLVAALIAAPESRKVLVWREGLGEWREAGSVPEISGKLPPPRPPGLLQNPADRLAPLAEAETTARLYRRLVLLVGFQILLGLVQAPLQAVAAQQGALAGVLVILIALMGLLVAISITAYNLSRHLGEGLPLLWAIAMFLPCINILVLLVLSSKAQAWCQRYGLKVGFLGPTKESIEELRRRLMTSSFE
jgi:hypothetical protein